MSCDSYIPYVLIPAANDVFIPSTKKGKGNGRGRAPKGRGGGKGKSGSKF